MSPEGSAVAAANVFVVDDEEELRRALARLLQAEGYAVTTFASATEFLASVDDGTAGCCVLDVAMPGLDGLEMHKRLGGADSPVQVVFLTGHGDIPMSVAAMKSGAVDFLTKPVRRTDLLRAVNAALQVVQRRQATAEKSAALRARYEKLTPREREVLVNVIAGKLNKQIAADLGTTEHTIKVHRGRVMEKLEVKSVAELVLAAQALGLVEGR